MIRRLFALLASRSPARPVCEDLVLERLAARTRKLDDPWAAAAEAFAGGCRG